MKIWLLPLGTVARRSHDRAHEGAAGDGEEVFEGAIHMRKKITDSQFTKIWQTSRNLDEVKRRSGYTKMTVVQKAVRLRRAGIKLQSLARRYILRKEMIAECHKIVKNHPAPDWSPNWKLIVYIWQTAPTVSYARQKLGFSERMLARAIQYLRRHGINLKKYKSGTMSNVLLRELGRYSKAVNPNI